MLVINGAMYKVNKSTIVQPHYTGEFFVVDCTRYFSYAIAKEHEYSDKHINKAATYIDGDDVYYECEYSPFTVNDSWELLSDLSSIRYDGE